MEQLRLDYFSRFLEQHAAREAIQFLRPRSTMEKYYNVFVLLYPIVAYFSQEVIIYRMVMMIMVLIFYFGAFIQPRLSRNRQLMHPNPAVHSWKFFMAWLVTILLLPEVSSLNNQLPILTVSYAAVEQWIACSMVLLGTWLNRVKLPLFGINKWAWLSSVLKGYWYQAIIFLLLWIFGIFPKSMGSITIPLATLDLVLFLGIASNLASYVVLQKSLRLEHLPLIAAIDPSIIFQKSFFLEIRDVGFVTAILILLSTITWDPFHYKDFWLYVGLTSFVIGAMLLITPPPRSSRDVSDLLIKDAENFECIFESDEWMKITSIASSLDEISEQVAHVTSFRTVHAIKKDVATVELFDFGKYTVSASPKALIPLVELENGILIAIIGEFTTTKKEHATADTASPFDQFEEMIVQPQELAISRELPVKLSIKDKEWRKKGYMIALLNWNEWNRIKQHFTKFSRKKKKVLREALTLANVDSWEELHSQLLENILLFTRWNGPLDLFRMTQSTYQARNVQKTQLPGIHLVRSPFFALINVMGLVKSLIVPESISYYQAPLLTLLDRPNSYFFLDSPMFSLLDTERGEVSKLFGFTIKSGLLSAQNESDIMKLLCSSSNKAESFLEGVKKIINGKPLKMFFLQQDDGLRHAMILSSTGMLVDVFKPHFYVRESRILRHLSKPRKAEIQAHIQENKEPIKDNKLDLEATQLLLLHVPQCAICHRPIRKASVVCPFCGEEFCREEWLFYVFENEQCPICRHTVQIPEKYRLMLEKEKE